MKKLFVLILIACFMLSAGSAFAVKSNYASDNVVIMGPHMGEKGITPVTKVVKVRYAMQQVVASKLTSGDVVVWDTTSGDGVTISGCTTDNDQSYAGVLVTDVLTAGVNATPTQIDGNSQNWGYMAVEGYCLAKCDQSGSTAGMTLIANGATLECSFATGLTDNVSNDIGVLLRAPASDTSKAPVWLK